jgi:very-short-patch-repair endonuclease
MTPNLTKLAKDLRKNATEAETLLWSSLRARQMEGAKFRRQQPLENYIVDFVSFENRIVIELDGGQHAEDRVKDKERDMYLKDRGFSVLRFWNSEVFENLEGVLETIRQKCINT